MGRRYIAVRGQDAGTVEALRMDTTGLAVVASDDADRAYARAVEIVGHEDVRILDRETCEWL